MNFQEPTDIYDRVTDFFIREKRSVLEVKKILVSEGITEEKAQIIIDEISDRIKTIKIKRANSNITHGIIFVMVGSIFCTASYIGYENLMYIGAFTIAWGIYKVIKGFINKSYLKQSIFSRTLIL